MSQPLFDPSPLITSHHNVVMAAGTDSVEGVDQPVTNGDVKSQSISAQSTHMSMSHYLGLPYQDHNYGQPPPPTPPQSPPPTLDTIPVLPLSTVYENSNPSFTPPEDNADTQKDEGLTRCICTFDHDDGYMICCDKCLVWQHVECMGLDRNNIPDVYFCERCEPRMVDQQRALELQTIKRKHILERLDSSDDDTKRKTKKTRYSSISTTPTSLTLTSTKGKNKMKKKKKKKEKEKGKEKVKEEEKDQRQEKHHKKKKKKKRKHRKNRGRTEPGIGDLLLHGEQILDNSDHFVEATENQYSMELNQYLSDQRQNAMWTIPSLGCIMDDLSPQKIKLGATGRTARGLVATEELAPNQPIVEYRGMLMLRDQFVPANGWTKKPYLHVLMYTKFSNIELCVDARKYGNIARYVRKSCSPNAEVRHVAIDGLLRLYLFSLVEITKGSEVTVAFDFSYKDCSHPVKCACSKKNCPVKRYWRKRRSLEARNPKKPGTDGETSASSKRTVSPLRVSLTAANGAEKRMEQVIEPKDVSKVGQEEKPPTNTNPSQPKSRSNRNSTEKPVKEVDPSSDNDNKDKVDVVAVDPAPPEVLSKEKSSTGSITPKEEQATPRSKMTREERKMEAIMKAFAKMEKAQERRQQALERLAHTKPQEDIDGGQENKDQSSGVSQQQQSSLPANTETIQVTQSDSGKEELSKSSDATTKDESSSNTVAPPTTPLTNRKPARRRRRSTMSSRRRNRSNSIASVASVASASTSVEVSSADDDSNPAPPVMMGTEKITTTTPLSISTSISNQDKGDAPLASPGSSSSKRFRFPKTKKFFMNEWLNEKAFESLASKPLTIKTEQLDLSYSSNLSSPNTPLLQRSGSLSALMKETRNNPLESSGGLAGSAKKRWLRQAMSEGNSNQEPATCNGTLSPIASPALSPNTSASSDLMTPLKKRMLRHSLAEEAPLGGSSPKHDVRTSLDSAPATPANQDAPQSEEPPILIQAKAELEPVQEEDSLFVTCSQRMKSQFTLTFPLPARKDVRKNSSIDSGLSVTTPAELEKSPITIKAGLEERLRDFSVEGPVSHDPNKDASSDLEAKTTEYPVDDTKDTNATVLAVDNNNLVKDESIEEKDDSKDVELCEGEMKSVEKAEKSKDEIDGSVNSEVDGRTKSVSVDRTLETSKSTDSAAEASAKVLMTEPEPSADSMESCEITKSELFDENKKDDLVDKSKDLKNRLLTTVTKSDLNSLYVSSLRTRHVSGPGAMQGRNNESGPLTLTTSFSDDSGVSSSSLYTPFSPKKRLLRQNTDPNEHRDAGLSMANSWPQQSFASPQRFISPKDESQGPNPQQNLTPSGVGASSSPLPAQGSPDRLSASWGPGGVRPNSNGPLVPPRNIEPGTTPSPSQSPGLPLPNAPVQGILKPGTPPLSAVRNLGNSLSAVAEGIQESTEVQTSQTASSVTSSATSSTTSSGESAPNSAQSTPVKKKVSLLEYRKRKGSSVKPASSSSSSSSSTSTTATTSSTSITANLVATSTTVSGKLPLITLPNIPLPDIPPADPLKDEPGKKSSKAPTKTSTSSPSSTTNPTLKTTGKISASPMKGEGGKTGKPGSKPSTSQSGFAIFSTKTKDGHTPTLTLTSEAQQVINSITSLLMEESHVHNGDVKDRSIRRSDSVPAEARYSRRNYQDKPWEKDGRGDAAGSLKRPLSPEPPPPPPGKKLCTGVVPPPPPPKGAVSRDTRPVENGPPAPLRQNSAPGGCVPGPVATNSPLKNVSGNTIIPAQYGIAHRNQNAQYQMQYGQQPQPQPQPQPQQQQQQQQQQQFTPTTYHQHPAQPQAPPPPQPQAAIAQPQQQQQPPRPVPPPQKHSNFNYQYSNQSTENANAQGFPQQQQRTGYPPVPYHQNQNQLNNHFGVPNKFSTNGRKSPYGSQDSNRQHTFYTRGNSNAYPARKNFHSK